MNNEFLLQDRLQKIRQIINQYEENNFYISFSGGKDSTVLSHLIDMALPENKIPRVYADTGIEYEMIRQFVFTIAKSDQRIIVLKPTKNIRKTLDEVGYPFKSKEHADVVRSYQNGNKNGLWIKHYLEKTGDFKMPDKLRYQFTDECKLKISSYCCNEIKEKPLNNWQREHNIKYSILGIRRAEGGRRTKAQCLAFRRGKLKSFQPLAPLDDDWIEWFIDEYKINICDIYKPPYNFDRTGCKGCPFNPRLQQSLDIMKKYFPDEHKQCEIIWKPVYDEYRRLNYRLKG